MECEHSFNISQWYCDYCGIDIRDIETEEEENNGTHN